MPSRTALLAPLSTLLLATALGTAPARAGEPAQAAQATCTFSGDLAACRESGPQPRYVLWDRQPTWAGNLMRWSYNPANQPGWIDTGTMLQLLNAAMAKWQAVCNIRFEYLGTTATPPTQKDGQNVIGWDWADGYDGYTQYWWAGATVQFSDVDMRLDPSRLSAPAQLRGLLNHELGHAIGLDHSDVSSAIMYANPYHSYAYQETLDSDDIAGCVALYGAPAAAPTASDADRVFDWAESAYASFFPSHSANASALGYTYRYYPATGLYLGTQAGRVVLHGGPYHLLDVGALSDFLALAGAAGF